MDGATNLSRDCMMCDPVGVEVAGALVVISMLSLRDNADRMMNDDFADMPPCYGPRGRW